MSDTQTTKWYSGLLSQLNTVAEELDLDPLQTEKFKEFTFSIAKSQYKTGNKSGIAWLHRQLRGKNTGAEAAAA